MQLDENEGTISGLVSDADRAAWEHVRICPNCDHISAAEWSGLIEREEWRSDFRIATLRAMQRTAPREPTLPFLPD